SSAVRRSINFFFSSRRRHTRFSRDWSSDVCSSDLELRTPFGAAINGGRVYVADFGNDRVQVFAADGSVVSSLGVRGSGDGQLLRSEERRVGKECRSRRERRLERNSAGGGRISECCT